MVNKCLIALGANLATSTRAPLDALRHALKVMEGESFDVTAVSRWYSTPAFPAGSGPDYVNAVACAQTTLSSRDVLERLAATEERMGRERKTRWGARVCDLDLLTYNQDITPDRLTYMHWRDLALSSQLRETPDELILPHPRLQDRAFVLIPLRDVAPDWHDPVTGDHLDAMIKRLSPIDVEAVKPLESLHKP